MKLPKEILNDFRTNNKYVPEQIETGNGIMNRVREYEHLGMLLMMI